MAYVVWQLLLISFYVFTQKQQDKFIFVMLELFPFPHCI
jgi:hypothetical protein